jgi:hypothetical protein
MLNGYERLLPGDCASMQAVGGAPLHQRRLGDGMEEARLIAAIGRDRHRRRQPDALDEADGGAVVPAVVHADRQARRAESAAR